MKKLFAYIPLLMLLFACGSEEDLSGQQGEHPKGVVEMPVVIALSGNTSKEMQTRAGEKENTDEVHKPAMPGIANVDKVMLYIFKSEKQAQKDFINPDEYTYMSCLALTDFINVSNGSITIKHNGKDMSIPVHNGDKVAVGNIKLDPETCYVIWTVAYAKSQEELFDIAVTENTTLSELKVQLKGTTNTTPELFVGCLYCNQEEADGSWTNMQEFSTTYPISDFNESTLLFGQLYRSVGRVSVTLTDIPEDIQVISLVSSIFPRSLPAFNKLFMENSADPYSYCYPMGYYNEKLTGEENGTTVATTTVQTINGQRTATLSSFFFPFTQATSETDQSSTAPAINRAYFYVCTDKGDKYMVKCADQAVELPTIWMMLYEVLISQNTFIVPINWDTRISGKFETLKQGNLKIDLSEMGSEIIGQLK